MVPSPGSKYSVPFSAGANDKSAHLSPPKEAAHPSLVNKWKVIAFLPFQTAPPERDFSMSSSSSGFRALGSASPQIMEEGPPQTPDSRATLSLEAVGWEELVAWARLRRKGSILGSLTF